MGDVAIGLTMVQVYTKEIAKIHMAVKGVWYGQLEHRPVLLRVGLDLRDLPKACI